MVKVGVSLYRCHCGRCLYAVIRLGQGSDESGRLYSGTGARVEWLSGIYSHVGCDLTTWPVHPVHVLSPDDRSTLTVWGRFFYDFRQSSAVRTQTRGDSLSYFHPRQVSFPSPRSNQFTPCRGCDGVGTNHVKVERFIIRTPSANTTRGGLSAI